MDLLGMFNTGAIMAMIATAKKVGSVYGYDSAEYSEAYYRVQSQEDKMTDSQKMDFKRLRRPN